MPWTFSNVLFSMPSDDDAPQSHVSARGVLKSVSPEIEPDKNQSSSYEDEHEPSQEDEYQ